MKKQEVMKKVDEKNLRDNFDRIQKQIAKWNEAYPSSGFERDEESGIHYVQDAAFDYKISTSSGAVL